MASQAQTEVQVLLEQLKSSRDVPAASGGLAWGQLYLYGAGQVRSPASIGRPGGACRSSYDFNLAVLLNCMMTRSDRRRLRRPHQAASIRRQPRLGGGRFRVNWQRIRPESEARRRRGDLRTVPKPIYHACAMWSSPWMYSRPARPLAGLKWKMPALAFVFGGRSGRTISNLT